VRVTLLSGDTAERAQRLAERLGLDGTLGGATPQAKLDAIAQAQAGGRRVAMVGDGVNDAPVLARADVSLAMGQGALVARASADAVIVSNRPATCGGRAAWRRRRCASCTRTLPGRRCTTLTCIPLALMGWLPPWAAGLGMAASSLLVIGNALRAAHAERGHGHGKPVPADSAVRGAGAGDPGRLRLGRCTAASSRTWSAKANAS
jgi:P-type Cu2+ transporter